jgi:hypothetical protein
MPRSQGWPHDAKGQPLRGNPANEFIDGADHLEHSSCVFQARELVCIGHSHPINDTGGGERGPHGSIPLWKVFLMVVVSITSE